MTMSSRANYVGTRTDRRSSAQPSPDLLWLARGSMKQHHPTMICSRFQSLLHDEIVGGGPAYAEGTGLTYGTLPVDVRERLRWTLRRMEDAEIMDIDEEDEDTEWIRGGGGGALGPALPVVVALSAMPVCGGD
ncbi:hypothetical protein Tco_1368183 [Tanacetum coccineum]